MHKAGILAMGSFVPNTIMSNENLSKIVDTSDEWIRTRTGIEERRIANEDLSTADMAYFSAKEALENANLSAEDIDMIIVATATPDHAFPSVACMVQEKLGATNASAFDLSAACSGFIYGLTVAKQFIENGSQKNILVIGAEKLSTIVDWTDRNTCVLFGDGAGAAVLGPVANDRGILSYELGADGTGGKHLYNDKTIKMNGREVFKFAVKKMGEAALNVIEKAGLEKEDIDYLVPHQANTRIIDSARERLGLSKDKVSLTVNKYGNTSAASIPLSIYDDLKEGKIKDGDAVVLVGFGGGLTWGSVLLKWGK